MNLKEKQDAMKNRWERQKESTKEPLIVSTSEGEKAIDFYELTSRNDLICIYCQKEHTYANKRTGEILPCKKCKAKKLSLSKYNLTLYQYFQILRDQDNRCAICTETFTESNKPVIDHCHELNHVRGFLCRSCNLAIGLFLEEESIFLNAIKYIKLNRIKRTWWSTDNRDNNY